MLRLRGLRRRYGETVALDGLSLDVPERELVDFVGPNGSGKTTAMRIALGVLEADGGQVHWRDAPVTREQQRAFGYMPEERGQQRVQLAAALVHDPPVLILDEAFSGLDPIGADVMSEVLSERARIGAAVIFSSHQLELVERVCDRVAIVNRGRIVAAGRVDELRAERSRPRLRVDVDGAANGWADGLAGVTVVARDADGVLLELGDGADDQRVLSAATCAGRVRRFAPARPTLGELFREVVER
jgi:ABC-2 type transport system ATP-binding protein